MTEVRALLLTDVVDSTQLSEALGDARMAEVWAAHDRVARDLLPDHGGLEIDKTDGFLMLFRTAAEAVAYATAYHAAIGALDPPLKARAGLHVGPVILRANPPVDVARGAKPLEVDGLAKPTAARVMSLALGGQTLLTPEALDALGPTPLRVESHGHWRMKGVSTPIELFEVGPEDGAFLPPGDSGKVYRVVEQGGVWRPVREVPHALPAERDRFVGRLEELGEIAERLDGGARLLSILGPGGAGKTRLALRYGWTWLGDYPGGVWFCDLSEVRDEEGLLTRVARTLEVPLDKEDARIRLGHAIAGRGPCLVILDTFEQVARHADAVLGTWLDRAPEARFVVTTRELLGLPGEATLVLPPLAADEALELFVARAAAVRPGFTASGQEAVLRELVDLLDRLPLAIELAAARVRLLPPERLLERMSQRFQLLASGGARRDRQATLRATLDWSWELLDPAEQAALAQASVFEGGFTLDLAELVLDVEDLPDAPWVMDLVQSLVDKSLLRAVGDRFEMLVSVKEYAAEQLAAHGDRWAALVRHGIAFADLPQELWEAERANLDAACVRAIRDGRTEHAVRCLYALWSVLKLQGSVLRARELAKSVLYMPLEPEQRRKALEIGAQSANTLGEVDRAEAWAAALLREAEPADDRRARGRALAMLGVLSLHQGRYPEAADRLDAALVELQAAGDRSAEAATRGHLGSVRSQQGQYEEARIHYAVAQELAAELGDQRTEIMILTNQAVIDFRTGHMEIARQRLEDALALARGRDKRMEASLLGNLGGIDVERGELDRGRRRLEDALAMHREVGHRRGEGLTLDKLAYLFAALGQVDEAEAHYAAALEIHRELGNRIGEAVALGNLGKLRLETGRGEAVPVLKQALTLHRQVDNHLFVGHVLSLLAQAARADGRLDKARARLEKALEAYRTADNAPCEASALQQLADVHREAGRDGLAEMTLDIRRALLGEA